MSKPPQRIVCAATKLHDGTLLIGARHWDMIMHSQFDMWLKSNNLSEDEYLELKTTLIVRPYVHGFIDQFGNFLDRKEAYVIANSNNQIIRDHEHTDQLYSEHLY